MSENETESGFTSSQESDELEDLERLANNIFDKSEKEGYQFHGFYEDQTVRDILGDWTMSLKSLKDSMSLQNAGQFESNWVKKG